MIDIEQVNIIVTTGYVRVINRATTTSTGEHRDRHQRCL